MKYFYKQELVKYDNGLPIKMYICHIKEVPHHWHKEMEIIYIADGSLDVVLENKEYTLTKNNIIIANANRVHRFKETNEDNTMVVMQINLDFFKSFYPAIQHIEYKCNSLVDSRRSEKYELLKQQLIGILKILDKKEVGYEVELLTSICDILLSLIRNFEYKTIDKNKIDLSEENLIRLNRIIAYIDKNYMKKISLDEIAEKEYLSRYYFSHFFKKKMGMSFQNYLKSIRLKKAHQTLIKTDEKIVNIALQNGFSSLQTFTKHFKEDYLKTPVEYRRAFKEGKIKYDENNHKRDKNHIYQNINVKNVLALLEE